jgi:hypothetical protein
MGRWRLLGAATAAGLMTLDALLELGLLVAGVFTLNAAGVAICSSVVALRLSSRRARR